MSISEPCRSPPELHDYLLGHSTPPDEIAAELIAETRAALPDDASMQVAPEQAAFLRLLTRSSAYGRRSRSAPSPGCPRCPSRGVSPTAGV